MRSVLVIAVSAVCCITTAAANAQESTPRTLMLRGDALVALQSRVRAKDAALAPAVARLRRDADKALTAPLIAVTDKRSQMPPSGDAHDYFSLSPYWWPDPAKANGLPYIRRDGETNPESKADLDQPRLARMSEQVQLLALAWWYTGDVSYATRAASQLRTWFLDPATRMTPHLRYAQLVRGNDKERGSGIIDSRGFLDVVDAAVLLQQSSAWSAQDDRALRAWFGEYLTWLRTSDNGRTEALAKNNHGSWFAAQTAAYALYAGDSATTREIVGGVRARIGAQISPEGNQAEELLRTRSYHYSIFNVEALARLAEMGRWVGIDLWSYAAPSGGSLRVAVNRLAPFVDRQKEWPDKQLDPVSVEQLLGTFRRARVGLNDASLDTILARLPASETRVHRSTLLFAPTAATPAAPAASRTPVREQNATQAPVAVAGPHPRIFLNASDATQLRLQAARFPLLARTLAETRTIVDRALAAPIDVPAPGEAGGYAHEKHKQNYREMQAAGSLYTITGERRYALWVRDVLEQYARLYPTLGPHPLSKNQAPGKLFHQSLNDANWLVGVAIAYDCIYNALSPAERTRIEGQVLRPMAEWMSVTQAKEFDRIHNHGTWAAASVGMLGLVLGDTSYVNRALYGTKGDKRGGFLRQLDELFSPDGYYMEGPYYIRYALLPFYQFAEALERVRPDVKIYAYRDSILKKGLYAAVGTAFPNGVFPPINDASRTMAIDAPEVVLALDLAYARYGANRNLLGGAAIQNRVVLNAAGLTVARDLAQAPTVPAMNFGSVEFTDGADGKRGGLGILRNGSGVGASMLLMKYGVHGEGHGHFDKLHFSFFDGGREVAPDYGFSRWINIEPKFGGRYLPENDSYAMQTIAHNTVVVDERTQNDAKEAADEAVWPDRHFFDTRLSYAQAMSARTTKHYAGVGMQRTMLMVRDARLPYPVIVDLFRLTSDSAHTYDWPLHFRGQLIATNVKYESATRALAPLGARFGYEHLWKEAAGTTDDPVQVTWLDGNRYYSLTSSSNPATQVIFARTGAGDPNFNLISEPMLLLRRRTTNHLFASVLEPHGFFNEAQERSEQARPRIREVRVLANTITGSVVEVRGDNGLLWTILVSHENASNTAPRRVQVSGSSWEWTGNFAIRGVSIPP